MTSQSTLEASTFRPNERRALLLAAAIAIVWTIVLVALLMSRHNIASLLVKPEFQQYRGWFTRYPDSIKTDDAIGFWASRIKGVAVRSTLLVLGVTVLLVCYALRRRNWALTRYFAEEDSPLQLAAVRIIVFGTVLFLLYGTAPLTYAGLAPELTIGPIPWRPFLRGVSFPYGFSMVAYSVVIVASVCGLIGLFTRTSSLLVAIVGTYVFLIAQSFGKVNHYHFVIWFPAILAFSPAGDMLSIDCLWRSISAARRGELLDLRPSRAYALPTRLIWLLLGQVYFFPGFYKIFAGNYDSVGDWFLSDGLQNTIAVTGYLQGAEATFPLQDYPLLCRFLAFTTVIWEFTWPVVILFPMLRVPQALGTILFHTMTNLIIHISFYPLRMMMLALLPWYAILSALGRWIFREKAVYVFDPSDRATLAPANVLASLNLFGQVECRRLGDGPDPSSSDGRSYASPGIYLAGQRLNEHVGWAAVCHRLGLPRFLLPQQLIERLSQPSPPVATAPEVGALRRFPTATPAIIAATIMALNFLLAVGYVHRAWPVALFPTFEVVQRDTKVNDIEIDMLDDAGNATRFDNKQGHKAFQSMTWYEMYSNAIDEFEHQNSHARLTALWNALASKGATEPSKWSAVRFYKLTIDSRSDPKGLAPLERRFLVEIPANAPSGSASPSR